MAWAVWWASPQATQWLPAYLPTIYRMARLLDAVLREPQKDLLAELRHLEDRFGLSPMALLRNRWLLDDATHDNSRAATVVRLRPVETT